MTEDEHDDIRVRAMNATRQWFDNLKEMKQCDFGDLCLAFIAAQRLAMAAEREACAKIAETLWNTPTNAMATEEEAYGAEVAAAIRSRSDKS